MTAKQTTPGECREPSVADTKISVAHDVIALFLADLPTFWGDGAGLMLKLAA